MAKHIMHEAKRCLNCKNPQCQGRCPIATDIPSFIQNFLSGNIEKAGEGLFSNNPLSVICSIVCPHEHQCEGGCVLGKKGKPVNISGIENYISDYYLSMPKTYNVEKKLGKIAIIGSGPAGLTSAFILGEKGFHVTLFEAQEKLGGFLRYGIPEFRLPNRILDTFTENLTKLGVKIRPNTLIGPILTIDTLFRDGYDAVFIATGVWNPNTLNIKGESLGHVHYAVAYLKNPEVFSLSNKVVVVGGGNTAMDVARTAIRKGSKDVTILYRRDEASLPAIPSEVELAKLDGVKFEFLVSPIEIGENYIKCVGNEIIDGTLHHKEDTELLLDVDSVIIAASQGPRSNIVSHTTGIQVNNRGLLIIDEKGMTTREGVFASGDVVTGAKTVVEAVHHTKLVCDAIETYIDNKYKE
ncbi:glutamate synthase [NADPH] small chain GltD [Clostridium aceticum]|uniref:Glutamate synthase [NADPH] small chain GltD n=1 Tax=Clostridium aceticum TaxID=84022 RepID=A0A0D8IA99_9CLOT|nr:NAD(P)-dependent oxidoreductase [Clostridium aceticum]AKL93613.1 glutamate synthase [NADPH] small chain GltD [Clostridium aceticum]KJF27198.1 dihydropyrimidine dehydrogenase [Clostridium aceticum]